MAGFRVTKYDPSLRDADGAYPSGEWTSASDIGKTVSEVEYHRVETSYVHAVWSFLHSAGIDRLRVCSLERRLASLQSLPADVETETSLRANVVSEGDTVSGDALEWLVRLALREVLWCRLEGEKGFYVHFGYDYCMYLGGDALTSAPPLAPGIFAERLESPYQAANYESPV